MNKEDKNIRSLEDINQDFNNSIPDDFSLSKDFSQNKLTSKIINLILLSSISVGAFAAFKHIEFIEKDRIELTNEILNNFKKPTVINMDTLEDIVKDSKEGIYQIENNDNLIVLSYRGEFDTDNYMFDKNITRLIELNHFKGDASPQATFGRDIHSVNYLNMNNNHFSGNMNYYKDVISEDSLLKENEDLWVFVHELNHISKKQYTYQINKHNTETHLDHSIALESASDIYSSIITSKIKGYNLEQTNKLIDEAINFREYNLIHHNDFSHATMFALKGFKEWMNSNPDDFKKLKTMDLETIDKLSSEYAFEAYRSIDKEELIFSNSVDSIINKDSIRSDVELFLEKGNDFQKQSNNIKELFDKKLNNIANGYFSEILEIGDKIKNGSTFEKEFKDYRFKSYDSILNEQILKHNYINNVKIDDIIKNKITLDMNKGIEKFSQKISHDELLLNELKISTNTNINYGQNNVINVKQQKGLDFKY